MKPAERYDAELPAARRRKAGLAPFILAAGAAMAWSMASAQDSVSVADAAEAAAEAAEAAADAAETAAAEARTAAESARTAAEAARSAEDATAAGDAGAEAAPAEDGWFSAEQVARGEGFYNQFCSGCHGSEVAESFSSWPGNAQQMMNSFIALGMPADNPGGLSSQQYIDIAGYIMNLGGLPLGPEVIADTEDTELARFP